MLSQHGCFFVCVLLRIFLRVGENLLFGRPRADRVQKLCCGLEARPPVAIELVDGALGDRFVPSLLDNSVR